MMGGLDTGDRGSSAAPRHRLNQDNGQPYFQPSSPSHDAVIIDNYSTMTICLSGVRQCVWKGWSGGGGGGGGGVALVLACLKIK